MELQLKTAIPALEQDWRVLWTEYLAFYDTQKPEAVYAATWARIIDAHSPMHSVLAYAGDKVVGLTNFLYHTSFWEAEDRCYLNDLYVRPDTRGLGAGKALIDATVNHATSQGVEIVYWTTARDNVIARGLYDKVAKLTPFIKYQVS
jgi:ribosomal protein S18 acetylase RimI-like enzyme